MSQADGADEDFSALPLSERVVHKAWKARCGAYDELAKLFRTLDPDADAEYRKWQDSLKKMVQDANAVAQEQALSAVLAYVQNAPSAAKTRNVLAPMVVEKCLGSSRSVTKSKAIEILLMYIEVENKSDGVIEDVIPGLDHKTPKNVVACVTVLREALRLFGFKVFNVKPVLKQLPKLFDHKDKSVRSEATALAVELYRWLGLSLMPSLTDLKPLQLKELNDLFETLPAGKAAAERLIRSEQAKREAVGYVPPSDDATAGEVAVAEPEPIDPFDISDPVNVLDKMPSNFYEQLASTKWQERKEILQSLLALTKFPKLEDGRYGELVNVLSKRVNDANVNVAGDAIRCIESIARGLRSSFSPYRNIVMGPLIERLKEKKQFVIEAIRDALDALFLSVTLPDIVEDVTGSAAHKNPQVRVEVLQWLIRCFRSLRKAPGKPEVKAFAEMLSKSIDDGDAGVRDSAAEAFGTLMKLATERAVAVYLEKMDKTKEAKVREFYDKSEVRVGGGPSAIARKASAPTAAISSPSSSKPIAKSEVKAPAKKSLNASAPSKKSSSSSSLSKPTASSSKLDSETSSKKSVVADVVSYKFSDNSAEAWMNETFPADVLAGLSDSAWKIRLQSAQSIADALQEMDPKSIESEAIVRHLCKTPGWKESNFQVMTSVLSALSLAAKAPSCSKGAAAIAISGLSEKLGDVKVKKVAGDCLAAFAESASLGFVLSELLEPLRKQKSPKVLSDALIWMHQSVTEFGVKGLAIKDIVEFIKFCLGNSNQSVRNSSVTLLGGLRMFIGPDIRALVADVNAQILAIIDAEFEKVAARQPPEPTKAQAPATTGGNEDPINDIFPRIDLGAAVSGEIIDNLGDAQWKVRKEALEEVSKVIESSNRRIKPNLGELLAALKARLGDSNKNLGMMAVEICGAIATAMGKPFERHVKAIFSPMASLLADQKIHIRTAALTAIENVYAACGVEPCVPSCGQSLMLDQPQMRKDLLKWLGEKLEESKGHGITVADMQPLVHPILLCLQDKNSDVRKFASAVLLFVAAGVGIESIRDKAGDLFKGAALASVVPYIDAARTGAKAAAATTAKITASTTPSKIKRSSSVDAPPEGTRSKLPGPGSSATAALTKTTKARPTSASAPLTLKRESPLGSRGDVGGGLGNTFPLLSTDLKAKELRAQQDRGMNKWTFETPRRELVDFLVEQCDGNLSPGLVSLLFSSDHYKEKDFLLGLSQLDDGIVAASVKADPDQITAVIANTDIILKYLTIRFFDTNTSTLLKCLEVLEHAFNLMDEQNCTLSDYEASAFLPFFVNKVGDNKETMRMKIRGIMRQICRIYPASKFFGFLMDALKSKNSRTRTECLEELADLIKRNGIAVCVPSKVFPVIAGQIADSDTKVRTAAIGVVTQAYMLIRDDVYKHLGRISEKDKSMIEEKIKRLPPQSLSSSASSIARPSSSKSSIPDASARSGNRASVQSLQDMTPSIRAQSLDSVHGTSAAGLVGVPGKRPMSLYAGSSQEGMSARAFPPKREFSLDLEKLNSRTGLPASSPAVSNNDYQSHRVSDYEGVLSREQSKEANISGSLSSLLRQDSALMLDFIISQITSGDAHQSIEALKQLEKALSTDSSSVRPQLDEVVTAITLQIRIAFTAADLASAGTGRLCKHLVNVLVQIFTINDLARSVGIETMQTCIQELLNRLLDPLLQGSELGPQLARALNVLMVRILENSDRNKSFCVLLNLLQSSTMITLQASAHDIAKNAKFTELVMKCLWKMTKVIPQLLDQGALDVEKLISTVHEFLERSPPADWKRRAADKQIPQADMPLRTVKTILHEVVMVYGSDIMRYVNVSDPHRSHAVVYIKQMLEKIPGAAVEASNGANVDSRQSARPGTASSSIIPSAGRTAGSISSNPSLDTSRNSTALLPQPSHGGSPTIESASSNYVGLPRSHKSSDPVSSAPRLNEAEADSRLEIIFDRIGMKDETKQGISDLYAFRKNYPEYEGRVVVFLGRTGNYFQGYIKRGLAALEDDEAKAGAGSIGGLTGAVLGSAGELPRSGSHGPELDSYKETLARLQQRFASTSSGSLPSSTISKPSSTDSLSHISRTQLSLQSTSRLASAAGSSSELQKRSLAGHSGGRIALSSTDTNSNVGSADSYTSLSKGESGRQTVEELKQRLARMKSSMPSDVL